MQATYESAIIQQSIGNRTSGFTRSSDQENAGLRHDGRYQRSESSEFIGRVKWGGGRIEM